MLLKKVSWLMLVVLLVGLLVSCSAPQAPAGTEAATAVEQATTTESQVVTEPAVAQNGEAPGAGARHVCAIGGADAFFAVVKNGADLAGSLVTNAGSEYTWIPLPNYDNIGPDMAKLEEQAIAQGCTSLAVPVWDGEAQAPALQQAADAGIAVFMYNSGLPLMEDGTIKALGYFGTDEYKAGLAAGKTFADNGANHVVCVNTQPGAVNHQQRCKGTIDGMTSAGGQGEELILPAETFGDAAAISAAVQAKLTQDPTIDSITTGSAADADAVAEALSAMGSNVMQGSFDVSANILDRIASGEALFAIDQQGWYQGWLAVSNAWLYDQFAILSATPAVLTGPAVITKDNVATVQAGVKDGYR
jgi:simple sugar transport system substrate-binding protein